AVPRLGEVTRCGVLSKYENVPVNKSFGTVLVERSIDLITFVLLFFINFFLFYDKLRIYVDEKILAPLTDKFNLSDKSYVYLLMIAALLVISGLLFFLLRSRIRHLKLYQKIKILLLGFWQGLWAVTKIKRPMVFVLQSLMIWFLYYLMIYVCFFSLPQTSHLGLEVAFSLLIFGSIGIMLVQGGIGIYPAIIAETLVLYNISPVHGYALGWLGWTAQTLMIVITGLVSLLLLPLFNKSKDHAES
ncbi:MAG: flippase-like domain-containing protein, partial [Candidatus Moranbacteria bacterium]|nr:flippase-like domain-containing protein [Candidatus Moranbacteria bacterium]